MDTKPTAKERAERMRQRVAQDTPHQPKPVVSHGGTPIDMARKRITELEAQVARRDILIDELTTQLEHAQPTSDSTRKDADIARVSGHADQDWFAACLHVVTQWTANGRTFFPEEVWAAAEETYGVSTHDRRAMTSVIASAKKDGLIVHLGARMGKSVGSTNSRMKPFYGRSPGDNEPKRFD